MGLHVMKNWVRRRTISTLMAMLLNENPGLKKDEARALAVTPKEIDLQGGQDLSTVSKPQPVTFVTHRPVLTDYT